MSIHLVTPITVSGTVVTAGIGAVAANTPVTIGIIVPLILTLVGIWGAVRVRGIMAPASALVLAFVLTVAGIMSVAGLVLYFNDQQVYTNCANGVERSVGNRQMWIDESERWGDMHRGLQALGVTEAQLKTVGIADWETQLLGNLDKNLPELDVRERCGEHP